MEKRDKFLQISKKNENKLNSDLTKISFKYSDWSNESFFLHGGTSEYYQQLVSCFQRILETRVGDWVANGRLGKYIKPIDWNHGTIAHSKFRPYGILDDILINCFEIRLSKSHGRVHGFLHSGSFFLVWFDPCHNLFPGTDGGKGKKLDKQEYKQVPPANFEIVNQLTEELETISAELKMYKETYDPQPPPL